jgi:hypothetical protein
MSDEMKTHAQAAKHSIPHQAPTDEPTAPFDPRCRIRSQ